MAGEPNLQVVIIAGPNGAGKTRLAPVLLRDWLGVMELSMQTRLPAGCLRSNLDKQQLKRAE